MSVIRPSARNRAASAWSSSARGRTGLSLQLIYITDVKVDRELAFADIFVSAVEGAGRSEEVLAGLESACGFIRRTLARRVELRTFPRLRFHWDMTPENADHIEKVLTELRKKQ